MKKLSLRRPIVAALLTTLGVIAACGSSDSVTVTPSVSGAFPEQAYRGRTLDVLLSGSGTTWDGTATATFGDGITVNKIAAASATALQANITVADTAAIGARDITVTQGTSVTAFKGAFSIASPIEVTLEGTAAQGSIVFLVIKNHDLDHLFDDTSTGGGLLSAPTFTNVDITSPAGFAISVSNVTPFRIDASMLIDVKATAGKFDLKLKSGPMGGMQDSFNYPAAFDIAARTAEALPTTGAMFNLDTPFASKLYTITPSGVDHLLELSATGAGANASAQVLVLKQSGSFKDVVQNGPNVSMIAANTQPLYVIVFDNSGGSGYGIAVTNADLTLATQAGGEGDNMANNVATTPIVLSTPPVIVKNASLTDATDVDWYKVTVPTGKRIRAQTLPGDANTDTVVTFYKADGTTMIGSPIDAGTHENVLSDALPLAGDYLIKISASSFFSASATGYELIVTLE